MSKSSSGTACVALDFDEGMALFVRCMAGKRPWVFLDWTTPPQWIIDLGPSADGAGREFVSFTRGDQRGTRYVVPWEAM